jgi:putative Holliday junction resolvase
LDAEHFAKLVKQESVVGIVVGLPVHMSGDESKKSLEAREFGRWLSETTATPVTWIDERYTTALARQTLAVSQMSARKKQAMVDKIAAQAILSAFLETGGRP